MADAKLTALTATTTPVGTDIVYTVVDPGGSPLSRKVTLSNLGIGVTGGATGILKGTAGVVSAASGGTDYENPLTFTDPLVRATDTISLNAAFTWDNTDKELKLTKTAIGSTPGEYGYSVVNTTAAAVSAQQYSPAFRWGGKGWSTDGAGASMTVDFRSYVIPVEGVTAPTGGLRLESSINAAAYAGLLTFGSDGSITFGASQDQILRPCPFGAAQRLWIGRPGNAHGLSLGNWQGGAYGVLGYGNTGDTPYDQIILGQSGAIFFRAVSTGHIFFGNATDDFGTLGDNNYWKFGGVTDADQMVELEQTETLTGDKTDGYSGCLQLDPGYTAATAKTVTRHNYINVQDISVAGVGPAAVTNAAVFRFDAAIATHKAVLAGFNTTDSGTYTTAWAAGIIININGTLYKIPCIAV